MDRRAALRAGFGALTGCAVSVTAFATRAASAARPPPTVFAAASLKNALDEVASAFAASGGGAVRVSYGASSTLAWQIERGAPAALFVSADSRWMDYLEVRRLIDPRSRVNLFTNHLALIAPANSPTRLAIGRGMPLAAVLGGGRLSLAGPQVPAGRYARASLMALGVFESVKDRLAPAEDVRAALAYVASGAAPLGIVYDTDARVEPRVRIVGLLPDASHPPIVYPAARVAGGRDPVTDRFLRFLAGPKAAAIFARYGFRRL